MVTAVYPLIIIMDIGRCSYETMVFKIKESLMLVHSKYYCNVRMCMPTLLLGYYRLFAVIFQKDCFINTEFTKVIGTRKKKKKRTAYLKFSVYKEQLARSQYATHIFQ